MNRMLAVLVIAIAVTGCVMQDYRAGREDSVLQQYSAGRTGCLPQDNVISNRSQLPKGFMWNASCKGRVYLCTNLPASENSWETSCAVAQ